MRICLVSSGLEERNRRLQPWRYLLETACALRDNGHEIHLVSDGDLANPLQGLPVTRLSSVATSPFRGNPALARAIHALSPDLVLLHLGLTSFLRLPTAERLPFPVVGLFTSPVYRPRELFCLGVARILRNWRLTAIHLLGLMVPRLLLRCTLHGGRVQHLVVECETTRARLLDRGISADRIHVLRPGIDLSWFHSDASPASRAETRRQLGYTPGEVVVGFFGPPAPLRGLPALLEATAVAREQNSNIKILALSRQRDGELGREQRALQALVTRLRAEPWARIETGFLSQERLIQTLAACDLVALPFEIVPSDVPLSVLEAMALGLPVITTDVACLPELVPHGTGLRVPPGETRVLATTIDMLASDRERRRQLGRAARQHAHAWQAWRTKDRGWDRLLVGRMEPA